jgi:hypothetical protein
VLCGLEEGVCEGDRRVSLEFHGGRRVGVFSVVLRWWEGRVVLCEVG